MSPTDVGFVRRATVRRPAETARGRHHPAGPVVDQREAGRLRWGCLSRVLGKRLLSESRNLRLGSGRLTEEHRRGPRDYSAHRVDNNAAATSDRPAWATDQHGHLSAPGAWCLAPAICGLLPAGMHLPPAAYCLLPAICRLLPVACRLRGRGARHIRSLRRTPHPARHRAPARPVHTGRGDGTDAGAGTGTGTGTGAGAGTGTGAGAGPGPVRGRDHRSGGRNHRSGDREPVRAPACGPGPVRGRGQDRAGTSTGAAGHNHRSTSRSVRTPRG